MPHFKENYGRFLDRKRCRFVCPAYKLNQVIREFSAMQEYVNVQGGQALPQQGKQALPHQGKQALPHQGGPQE